MFPLEIWENILLYVTDVETICSCREVSLFFLNIINNTIKGLAFDKRIKEKKKSSLHLSFLNHFSNLKYLYCPVKINTIYELDKLKHLPIITLKYENDLLHLISFLEEYLFANEAFKNYNEKEKCIKIYQGTCIYWIKRNMYGKYEKYSDQGMNEIDGQFMDTCRCKTVISNKKPTYFFPVQNFTYLCSPENITAFDYHPTSHLINYQWQPISCQDRRYNVDNLKYLSKVAEMIYEVTSVNEKIETYEMPILEKNFNRMKIVFPNVKNYCILNKNQLIFNNKSIDLENLPDPEKYIDSLFF